MRKILFVLMLFGQIQCLIGQQSKPIHADWYYGGEPVWSWFNEKFTTHLKFVKDTIIKGNNCSELSGNGFACMFNQYNFYVFEKDNSVYFYEPILDTFELLYNYNATKGYQNKVVYYVQGAQMADTTLITVDSVGSMTINNHLLKTFNVTYSISDHIKYNSKIIENIGDMYFYFNLMTQHMICDVDYPTGLRCYEDSIIGLYKTDTLPCDHTVNIEKVKEINKKFSIQPNPVEDQLRIINQSSTTISYSISNLAGQVVKTGFTKDLINVSELEEGVYLLKLLNSQTKEIEIFKIIKK